MCLWLFLEKRLDKTVSLYKQKRICGRSTCNVCVSRARITSFFPVRNPNSTCATTLSNVSKNILYSCRLRAKDARNDLRDRRDDYNQRNIRTCNYQRYKKIGPFSQTHRSLLFYWHMSVVEYARIVWYTYFLQHITLNAFLLSKRFSNKRF